MKTYLSLLFGIVLVVANACGVPAGHTQTVETPEIVTPGLAQPEATLAQMSAKEGLYENEHFSFTIPEGWGQTLPNGEFFDLGVQRIITIHNVLNAKKSVAFFTVASAALSEG
ncbi:MAG TPA: hypothetical protein VLR89_07610 [Anaerolineaceae bacterium]|nr:hypothetical protein [Anaerolineaceae bacterium]